MSLFVVITFDLERSNRQDYECVKERLGKLGIKKHINKKRLPQNIFIGRFEDDQFKKSGKLRDYIKYELKKIFKKCGVNGPYFIFVGDKWAWKKGIAR